MQNAAPTFQLRTDSGGQHYAEATESPRPGEFLDDWPASDEAIDDHDHRNDEQDMDQPAPDVYYEEPKDPKNKEYYRDSPKHDGILARSELHLARLKLSPLCTQPPRSAGVMLGHNMRNGNQHACASATTLLAYGESTPNSSL